MPLDVLLLFFFVIGTVNYFPVDPCERFLMSKHSLRVLKMIGAGVDRYWVSGMQIGFWHPLLETNYLGYEKFINFKHLLDVSLGGGG